MRISALLSVACVSLAAAVVPHTASAMPAAGLGHAGTQASSAVEKVEFLRRPDGSVWYERPDPNSQGPYLFYYRGYAYPYYPGYTYRLTRGELRPEDRPHRVKVVQ
jgi:hypothetical protein